MTAWNFAAGPSRLPDAVIARAGKNLFARDATGASLNEQPFSGAAFRTLRAHATRQLAELIDLPEGYRILFLAGGAMQQFSLLPLNLATPGQRVGYVDTGYWAARAASEAALHRPVLSFPPPDDGQLAVPDDLAYCHLTTNETADGLAWPELPELVPGVPLVADATADFLCRPLDIGRIGLLYASAQKNIGVAGLAVVIVREDLLARSPGSLPGIWSYARQAEAESCVNTPPILALQLAAMVFDWVAGQGGLPAMAAANRRKAARVYGAIEACGGFYQCPVVPAWRSSVNVCWQLPDTVLTERFIAEAGASGLHNLAGHPRRGGIRASLYNAMPEAGAAALADFMTDFARRYG